MPCLEEQSVIELLNGRLAFDELGRAEKHLAECDLCQQLVGAAAGYIESDVVSDSRTVPTRLQVVGGYVLKERLGHGGTATVYRAARPGGRDVALKIALANTPNAVASLRNEIRALRKVRHPGVVRVVDDGLESGVPWLAMELLTGERFDAILRASTPAAGRPIERSVLTILRRLCETLAYLHGRGLVHRDLSPRNVIVRDGHPVLIDFGFASIPYEESRKAIDDSTIGMGTLPYLAPEQIRGDEVDARTDLYAMGCLLYEALTGRPPFVGSPQEIVRSHLLADVVPPSGIVAQIPPELDALVGSLLAKDRRARVGYALDVADRLALLGAEGLPHDEDLQPRPYLYACSLVGRSGLLSELEEILASARSGEGAMSCVAGESGVGKTRLLSETARIARQLGMRVVAGRCMSVDAEGGVAGDQSAGPLHPLRSLLQLAADHCREGGLAETVRLFGSERPLIAEYDRTLAQVIGALGERQERSADGARDTIVHEAKQLLRGLAQDGGLLFVIDDLQWADELTFALLESLRLEFVGALPLAIIGAYRSDEIRRDQLAVLKRASARTFDVERLDRDAAETLVREMLGTPGGSAPILHHALSDAQGNPFFLTEYVQTAVVRGWLRRGRLGGWALQAAGRDALLAAQGIPLPESLRMLFQRRLADVDDDARAVLLAASVVGAEMPLSCVAGTLAGMPARRLSEAVDLLCERQLMLRKPDDCYSFSHDKIRETIYELTPEVERRAVHLRAGVCLEEHRSRGAVHGAISDEALAHHFAVGGDSVRAIEYLERAGDLATRSGAHRAATELFGRAIELGDALGGALDPVRTATWSRKRAHARFAIGDVEGCIEDSRVALRQLGHRVPRTATGWIVRVVFGLVRLAGALLFPWLRLRGAGSANRLEAARCAGELASAYYFTVELTPMLAVLLDGFVWARWSSAPDVLIGAQARLAYVAGVAGFHRIAASSFASAEEMALRTGHRQARALSFYLRALHGLGLGEWDAVIEAASVAAALLEEVGDIQDVEIAQTVAAHARYYRGEVTLASSGFDVVLTSARERTNRQHIGWALFAIARSSLALGQDNQAVGPLEEAREILRTSSDRYSIAICEGLLATAYVRTKAFDVADAILDELMARLALGSMPLPPCFDAYLGAAEASFSMWRNKPEDRRLARRARRALRELQRFAAAFPMARAAFHRLRGEHLALRGRIRPAIAAFRSARALARRRCMTLDAAAAQAAEDQWTSRVGEL
jgi:predicted Ser/Thr protein kinase/tetratricopeptide (TPR) repeat protein